MKKTALLLAVLLLLLSFTSCGNDQQSDAMVSGTQAAGDQNALYQTNSDAEMISSAEISSQQAMSLAASSEVILSKSVSSKANTVSSRAAAASSAVSQPQTQVINNVEASISRIQPGALVTQLFFNVRLTDGSVFDIGTAVDFESFAVTDEKGKMIRKGVGNNEYYDGIRCRNYDNAPVDSLEGWLTVETAKLTTSKKLTLILENMTIYTGGHAEPNFNITQYLNLHPELNLQNIPVKVSGQSDLGPYYVEPVMPKGNLNLRFDDSMKFVIDNLCIINGLLLMRIDMDSDRYMNSTPFFSVYEGQNLIGSRNSTSSADGSYALVFPLSQGGANELVIKAIGYRAVIQETPERWTLSTPLDLTGASTGVFKVTKVVGGNAGGQVKVIGECLDLVEINCGTGSVSHVFKTSGTYQRSENEGGGSTSLFYKDGNNLSWKNFLSMTGTFCRAYAVADDFTPDQLGAVVVTRFYKDNSVDQYVFSNFDFAAGTCQLNMISDTSPDASWKHLKTFIAGLYPQQ